MKQFGFFTTVVLALATVVSCKEYLPEDAILQDYNWSVQLENLSDPSQVININSTRFDCEVIGRGEFKYSSKDATVVLKWENGKNQMSVTPTVTNTREGWAFTSIIGPLVPVDRKIEDYNIYLPHGFGEIFTKTPQDSPEFTKSKVTKVFTWRSAAGGKYFEIGDGKTLPSTPSRSMTMPWLAFAGPEDGLYIASIDTSFTYKDFSVRYYPEEDICRVGIRNHHILFPGESWTFPTEVVRSYKGDWHAAADMYREWFNSVKAVAPRPEWLKKSTGWLLAILKQQNDEIIWPYGDIPASMADVAEARGLDVVGLFGWTVGGHDRFYPEYDVCPRMGGEETLRKSLKELHERGMRAIIYTNGQLLDQNGAQFWEDTGKFITVTRADGTLAYETWHKYSDAPSRTHGLACHSSDVWRQRMLFHAKLANDLGADGILYDQLGNRTPMHCYNPDHGHAVPAIVFEQDRQSNLDYVRTEMAKINPDFIVMTEGTQDAELSAIDLYHGCTYGVYVPGDAETDALVDKDALPFHCCPEILKYTLPQMECTVRHPCPVANRRLMNYGITYGFKHEIESRYAADKKYLLEDYIPEVEDYGNVISKPNLKLVRNEDAVAMRIYSKQVLDLKRKYTEALLEGTFKDDLGVNLTTDGKLVAKVFEACDGTYSAAVVWNTSKDAAAEYAITLDGRKPVSVDSPEGEAELGKIAAESVQVVIFDKNN